MACAQHAMQRDVSCLVAGGMMDYNMEVICICVCLFFKADNINQMVISRLERCGSHV